MIVTGGASTMYLAVFVGGAVGSLSREWLIPHLALDGPATSTFLVNVAACLLLGWLQSARHRLHEHAMHLGAVGFCGGLSTFSSFVADIARMAAGADVAATVLAPTLEIVVGLAAAALGLFVGRALHGRPP